MAKIIYAIENSFDNDKVGGLSDIAAGVAFLALIAAACSWLLL